MSERSYVTGESPNLNGACSPAKAVRWLQTAEGMESRLNGMLIDRYEANEKSGYPTLCKGRFVVEAEAYYAIEEPTSLNTLELLPKLIEMGVWAVKIEERQRSSAYVEQVTRVWRKTIDHCLSDPQRFSIHPE
jgi:O2-independent ubiquinone biosynthesis protein UbiU